MDHLSRTQIDLDAQGLFLEVPWREIPEGGGRLVKIPEGGGADEAIPEGGPWGGFVVPPGGLEVTVESLRVRSHPLHDVSDNFLKHMSRP